MADTEISLDQVNINIPTMFIPIGGNSENYTLLVSSPDGRVLDFVVTPDQAREIPGVLGSAQFWNAVFTSLIASFVESEKAVSV